MYLLCLVSFGILSSCGATKTKELVSLSSDKSNTVKISGSRVTSLDPFKAQIIFNGYNQSDTLETEIYAKDLNDQTVLFNWTDNSMCTVTFIQQDDSKRSMGITFKSEGNYLTPLN